MATFKIKLLFKEHIMKKLTKFSLTLLTIGLLSACGSSGGGSGNNNVSPSQTANTSTDNTSSTSTNTSTTTPLKAEDKMGNAFRTTDGNSFDIKKSSTYQTQLVVDGKTLPVAMPGISSGGFTQANKATINGVTYDKFVVSGYKLGNLKFGLVDGYVFAQGNVTPESEIPTSGAATYLVNGVFIENGTFSTSNDHILNVDFANKTVNGDVAPDVRVTDAKISGNEFEGKAVYNDKSAELKGHFYGSNASEIGGAYGSSSFAGSFGGKKQ